MKEKEEEEEKKEEEDITCSITSGAIQQGVPTKVFLTLFRVISPPVAKKALTPKSGTSKKKAL